MIFYLDCDTGIDDALAVALLLAHDDVELVGIGTVDGNTSAPQAAANTLGLLALAGRDDIPVAIGTGVPRGGAKAVHGGNGVGGVTLPAGGDPDPRSADQLLVDLARAHPGELHVLATGPCTNLAAALTAEPGLPGLVASVTVMGGAVRTPGNVTDRAEANIAGDPAAAAAVFAASWPVTLVPLDVTMSHRAGERDRAALQAAGTPLLTALADMLPVYFDFYEPRLGERRIPLHDPLAAAVAVGDIVPADAPELGLRVDVDRGVIIEDPGATTRVRVVLALDAPAEPVILARILGDLRG
ncbi:nucleoside hydrolase [Micromonosporaceae bacterium Da 78-11]